MQWLADLTRPQGKHAAIDGKAIRAACEKVYRKKVPMLINALMVDTGICIGQLRMDAKTNEIKGIPDLLDWLDLKGAVVTTNASGCQKDITKILLGKGADFVLPVDEWSDVAAAGMVVRERLVIHRGEDGKIIDEEPTVET